MATPHKSQNYGKTDTLGMRLAYIREQARMTQLDLSLEIGHSKSVIAYWERDLHVPSADVIREYAEYFGVSAHWILFGEDYEL